MDDLLSKIRNKEIRVSAAYNGPCGQSVTLQMQQSKAIVAELIRLAQIGYETEQKAGGKK